MEQLTKHQLILVAVLISFVTSLATGITTVSLMEQSPNVGHTITQIIQKTVATVPAGATSTAAVAIAVSDQVADATDNVLPSIVRLRDGDHGPVVGLGLIVSSAGAIMTDKNVLDTLNAPQAVFSDGASVPVVIVRFQVEGNIAFIMPSHPIGLTMKPIAIENKARLGESVWTLNGTSTYELAQGIVSEVNSGMGRVPSVKTSITSHILPGAPLFTANGTVLGISTGLNSGNESQIFYPVSSAKEGIPK